MSDSREKILSRIRQLNIQPLPQPDLNFEKISFSNLVEHFCRTLESVGGSYQVISNQDSISQLTQFPPTAKVISSIDSIPDQNINRREIKTPHDMQDIDYCCFKAQLGVAENGAMLTFADDFPFRSVYFLAQHLIVLLDAKNIKNNMHEAYEMTESKPFYTFISGPSKTADIEQCLVIGAHGARSLKVFICS